MVGPATGKARPPTVVSFTAAPEDDWSEHSLCCVPGTGIATAMTKDHVFSCSRVCDTKERNSEGIHIEICYFSITC